MRKKKNTKKDNRKGKKAKKKKRNKIKRINSQRETQTGSYSCGVRRRVDPEWESWGKPEKDPRTLQPVRR